MLFSYSNYDMTLHDLWHVCTENIIPAAHNILRFFLCFRRITIVYTLFHLSGYYTSGYAGFRVIFSDMSSYISEILEKTLNLQII